MTYNVLTDPLNLMMTQLIKSDDIPLEHLQRRLAEARCWIAGARFGASGSSEDPANLESRLESQLRLLHAAQRRWKFDAEGWYREDESESTAKAVGEDETA